MEIHLLRHAHAVPQEAWSGDETERPLTDAGLADTRAVARGLDRLGARFDLIVTSPYRRAVQTAEITALVIGHQGSVEECPALSPGLRLDNLSRFVAQFPGAERLLLVGHQPDLGHLALALLGAPRLPGLALPPAGCCRVDVSELPPSARGRLVWMLPPALLGILGGDES
jgi:phosphohistidine phosphatase